MKFWVKKQEGFIEGNAVDFSSIFLFPSASVFGARVTEPKNGGLWKRGEKERTSSLIKLNTCVSIWKVGFDC